jgi:hypothetical protein
MCVRRGRSTEEVAIIHSRGESGAWRPQRTFALAAGALLAAAVVWLLALGPGSTQAAGGHHHRGHHHHHHHQGVPRFPKDFLGVLPGRMPFDPTDAAKIADTKIRTVRIGLSWSQVQPRRGPFLWAGTDLMVARLAAQGIKVFPTLGVTPSWVASTVTTAPLANAAAKAAWQKFVTATVNRYGNGGTFWKGGALRRSPFHIECGCNAPPVPIKAWQVWNEPNLDNYFTQPSPKRYAKLVKISHPAIKAGDSKAKVVLGGISDPGERGKPGAIPYLKKFYRIPGIKQSFDAVAIHPYARNIRNLRFVMGRFRKVMKQRHDQRTPLWVTEMGWGSGHPDRFGHNKGIQGQKRMLQNSMTLLAQKRKVWHLQHAYWFYWRDPPPTTGHMACSFCSSAGLLRNDRTPKPAYSAFKRLAARAR